MLRLRGYHCCYVLCALGAEAEETVELENIVQYMLLSEVQFEAEKAVVH